MATKKQPKQDPEPAYQGGFGNIGEPAKPPQAPPAEPPAEGEKDKE